MAGCVHYLWKYYCYSGHYYLGGHLVRLFVQCSIFAGNLPMPHVGYFYCIVD